MPKTSARTGALATLWAAPGRLAPTQLARVASGFGSGFGFALG